MWSTNEACDVVDLISKWNKLWKRFRDSLTIHNISNLYLHCTEQPPQYWCYPPTVLKVSPTVLKVPPLYWIPSTVLMLSLHCTDVTPCMYWCYPPMYWRFPPLYWILSTVLKLSPPLYWCCPPLHWTTSTVLKVSPQYWSYPPHVLNNLHSTEPTLYGVVSITSKSFMNNFCRG